MRWGPAKPRSRIKVVECGRGLWDEEDHGLDIPHPIETTDFKITGTGHERTERIFRDCCSEGPGYAVRLREGPKEQQIARWIYVHVSSFVMFDTKARATVIGFEREEDADAFRRAFASRLPQRRAAAEHDRLS